MSWKNIVLAGGGTKGIAEVGALSVLEDRGYLMLMNGFAGSSAGGIIAGLLACNAKIPWLKDKIHNLNFRKFEDDSWGVFQDMYRLYWSKGWHVGNTLTEEYKSMLRDLPCDPEITLQEIYSKYGNELKLTVTKIYKINNVPTAETVILHRSNYPNMKLYEAVRMTAGFPYYFQTVSFENGEAADGGILMNYPIDIFDDGEPSPDTIGLKLISENEFKKNSPGDIQPTYDVKEFTSAIIDCLYTTAQQKHEHTNDWIRTVPIPTGDISAMNFNLTTLQKKKLYDSGVKAMVDFLDGDVLDDKMKKLIIKK